MFLEIKSSNYDNELFSHPYTFEDLVGNLDSLWLIEGVNLKARNGEQSEHDLLLATLSDLIERGKTLNFAKFFIEFYKAITNNETVDGLLLEINETHFMAIIYPCVPLIAKNRDTDQELYYQALRHLYFSWGPMLKKMVTTYKENVKNNNLEGRIDSIKTN